MAMVYANVAEPFIESVRRHPDKLAVVHGETTSTYREMNDRINQTARLLTEDLGVMPGDRVAYLLPNGAEILEIYYAVQKIGAVAVPLNFKLIAREIAYLVAASASSVLLFAAQFADKVLEASLSLADEVRLVSTGGAVDECRQLEPLRDGKSPVEPELFTRPAALSRIQYTGGSTGLPKGAARTHHADLVELDGVLDSNRLGDDPQNVVLIQCPLEHHGGHSWFTATFAAGATLIICDAFDAEGILRRIERHRVTYMILLPPTTYGRLLSCPAIGDYDLSSVRLVQSSAGGVSRQIVEMIYDRFPNAILNYGWGQSESGLGTSLVITRAMLAEDSPLLASIGKPMKHMRIRLVGDGDREVCQGDIGEALVCCEAAMEGYYGQDELTRSAFTADGWLRTGDMMSCDKEGYYTLQSRKKDMIKSGGENVFVGEVERTIRLHPAVADCVVFGTKDPVMGEAVAAVVELKPGATCTADELRAHCRSLIASYKKPRYIVFTDALGRNDAGKVRKDDVVSFFNQHRNEANLRPREAGGTSRPLLPLLA